MNILHYKKTLIGAGVVAILAVAIALYMRPAALDVRFNGAYRLDDGRLMTVIARDGKTLRYTLMNGESRALWPLADHSYEAGPGWNNPEPVEVQVTFDMDANGRPTGLILRRESMPALHATRLALKETNFGFTSGDLKLRARLVMPVGLGPFPAVVIAQGSEEDSAIDTYYQPYLFAAQGIATLVYDKRGTGGSDGIYTENFRLLAHDLSGAINWLRADRDIDPNRVSLSGYSQGGWVAPLAAVQNGHVRSLLLNYGPVVPVIDEDRWGYIFALRHTGYGQDAIARVDDINTNVSAILDRNEDRWNTLAAKLDKARHEPWFNALKGSDSALGYLLSSGMPIWIMRIYESWLFHRDSAGPYIDRLYDPVPTVAALKTTPSLWIFGGRDHSIPTQWSVKKLDQLQSQGCAVSIRIYPDADHGILRVRYKRNGDEQIQGFEPGYFAAQIHWLRRQSGLGEIPDALSSKQFGLERHRTQQID